jgi:L-threonylcarbamoyladenylate synthase
VTTRIVADEAAGRAAAVEVLRAGGIVALPTDTVYGIAVALDTPGGVEALFAAKHRLPDKGIMLLLADAAQAPEIGEWPTSAAALADAFWPGGLTLIVPQRPDVALPAALTGGAATIGLRVPNHDAPRALARAVGPLPTTSANLSGVPEARDAAGIVEQLGDAVALVLDGGPTREGRASTIVDCSADPPRIIRSGAVRWADIERVLGQPLNGNPPRQITIAEVQATLDRLIGMPLNSSNRAVDMEMFDFGKVQPQEDRRGREYLGGDTALHVQAFWRIVHGDRIVVGYRDLWDPPSGGSREGFDPSEGHRSHRDELLEAWFADRSTPRIVVAAMAQPSGDLRIDLDDGSALEILPMSVADEDEFWRLFDRGGPHVVVGGSGMERSGD